MSIRKPLSVICCLFVIIFFFGQKVYAQEKFRIMFYNAENLYDVKDNPHTNDGDFTPEGKLRWNHHRYWKKLHDVSKVITSVGEGYPPAIVGLCEVENDSVLVDLTRKAALQRHKYQYIITNSKDARGANIALLYQRDQIKILSHTSYTPILGDSAKATRDILHVAGKVVNGKILDIFICHFPSRNEGIKKSRPYRIRCAELLRHKTDSLFRIRKDANIVIMGDFNDYPYDISIKETLGARGISDDLSADGLYNMFYERAVRDKNSAGSYKYRGKWGYIDQFIVSGNLLSGSRLYIKNKEAHVFSADFLMEKDNPKYGGTKPFRTYSGYRYLGGISDHLPIYMDLVIKEY